MNPVFAQTDELKVINTDEIMESSDRSRSGNQGGHEWTASANRQLRSN